MSDENEVQKFETRAHKEYQRPAPMSEYARFKSEKCPARTEFLDLKRKLGYHKLDRLK